MGCGRERFGYPEMWVGELTVKTPSAEKVGQLVSHKLPPHCTRCSAAPLWCERPRVLLPVRGWLLGCFLWKAHVGSFTLARSVGKRGETETESW